MKPSYYAIIPANVRYSNLKPHAKLLYGEITALSSKEGYCFASNRYFAELYGVTKNTISSWISDLNKAGFVSVQIIKEGNQVIQRRIGITQKGDTPITKKDDYSSTSINTTINSLSNRRNSFEAEVFILEPTTEISNQFILYWSELNKTKTKMRWELEKTWDTKARIDRWKMNQQKWSKPIKTSKVENSLNVHQQAKEMILKMNNK